MNAASVTTPPRHPLLDRLGAGAVVADGAIESALPADRLAAQWARVAASPHDLPVIGLVLDDPEAVLAAHRAAVAAGATLLRTATRNASQWRLAAMGITERPSRLICAAVRLARQAAGTEALVLGVIGSLGLHLARLSPPNARLAALDQLGACLEAGVDGLVLEGIADPLELYTLLEAVRRETVLPIVALKTFHEDGATLEGPLPAEVARRLLDLGADVVGAACAVGPQRLLTILDRMAGAEGPAPLAAFPSGGMGRLVDGRVSYSVGPAYLADAALAFRRAGARLIGGCCGITPAHLAAVSAALGAPPSPVATRPAAPLTVVQVAATDREGPGSPTARAAPSAGAGLPPTRLARALGREFVVTVELDVPRGLALDELLEAARALAATGLVHAADITDGARARLRMHPLAVCRRIEAEVGLETICHLACRDRNLLALQSDLLAAHALGQRHLLPVTGDPPTAGDFPQAAPVFDVDSVGLVRMIAGMNRGQDLAGTPIDGRTSFLIAVAANPTAENLDRELERLARKAEAGAHLVLTQPLFDVPVLEAFVRRVEPLGLPVLVGVLPLRSSRHAEFLHHEVAGMAIPDAVRERLRRAGEGAARVGVELARAFVREARGLTAGVYLMPPFRRYELVSEILEGVSAGPGSRLG